jgi:hypothetical protein
VGGGERRRQLAPLGLGPGPLRGAVVPATARDHHHVGPVRVERAVGPDPEAVGAGDLGRPVERDQVHLEVDVAHGGGVAQHLQGPDGVQLVEPLEHDHGDPHLALLSGLDFGPSGVIALGLSTRPS